MEKQFPSLRGYVDVSDVGQAAKDWPQLNFIIPVTVMERHLQNDQFAKIKAAYEAEGADRSNLRYGYVNDAEPSSLA